MSSTPISASASAMNFSVSGVSRPNSGLAWIVLRHLITLSAIFFASSCTDIFCNTLLHRSYYLTRKDNSRSEIFISFRTSNAYRTFTPPYLLNIRYPSGNSNNRIKELKQWRLQPPEVPPVTDPTSFFTLFSGSLAMVSGLRGFPDITGRADFCELSIFSSLESILKRKSSSLPLYSSMKSRVIFWPWTALIIRFLTSQHSREGSRAQIVAAIPQTKGLEKDVPQTVSYSCSFPVVTISDPGAAVSTVV